jgi:hypothetical protein
MISITWVENASHISGAFFIVHTPCTHRKQTGPRRSDAGQIRSVVPISGRVIRRLSQLAGLAQLGSEILGELFGKLIDAVEKLIGHPLQVILYISECKIPVALFRFEIPNSICESLAR